MRLDDLTPFELAERVSELYMADLGDGHGRVQQDLFTQVSTYLRGKPELADQVLQAWMQLFEHGAEFDVSDREDAAHRLDVALLGGIRQS